MVVWCVFGNVFSAYLLSLVLFIVCSNCSLLVRLGESHKFKSACYLFYNFDYIPFSFALSNPLLHKRKIKITVTLLTDISVL